MKLNHRLVARCIKPWQPYIFYHKPGNRGGQKTECDSKKCPTPSPLISTGCFLESLIPRIIVWIAQFNLHSGVHTGISHVLVSRVKSKGIFAGPVEHVELIGMGKTPPTTKKFSNTDKSWLMSNILVYCSKQPKKNEQMRRDSVQNTTLRIIRSRESEVPGLGEDIINRFKSLIRTKCKGWWACH